MLWASSAGAQWLELRLADPGLNWRTMDTAHFSVHFAEKHRVQAQLVAAIAETVHERTTRLLAWEPRARTHIAILDSADFSNGYATPVPFNLAGIFLSPPDEGELLQNREWLELVLTHEYFHVVHLDKARGGPLALRSVFGRLLPLFPNLLEPRWVTEGLAVHAESDAGRGYGRLGQSHYEGMMRAEVERGPLSLRELNADGRGFPLNRNYLYGSYFFAFLRERFGERAVIDYIENYSGNLVPFRLHSNPRKVTGKPMDDLWLDYQDWLRARFAPKSAESAEVQGKLLKRAFSVSSPALSGDGSRWYVEADGVTRPKLMRQSGGENAVAIREVEQGTRIAALPGNSILLSQLDICRNYNLLYDLHELDSNHRIRRLSECGRFRFAAPLTNGRVAAMRVEAGEAEVVVLGRGGEVERSLYRAAKGESLTGIAASGDRIIVTSLRHGAWSLLELGDGRVSALITDAAVKHSPRFGDSADEIFFVADYGKVYNVWSLRPGQRGLVRWTQARNGVREISAPVGGEMLLTTIEADGDALWLYRLPGTPFERRDATVSADPSPYAVPGLVARDEPYSPWSSLRPRSWFPLIELANGAVALGAATNGQDALGMHEYLVGAMVETTQQQLLGSGEYVYDGRHGVLVDRQMTVTRQQDGKSNGDIRAYSIEEHAQWVSLWRQLALNTRFYWGLGAAVDKETRHDLDVGGAKIQDERVVGLVAGVDTRRTQWLSEGPSQGQQLRLFAETSNGLGGMFSGNAYRADWRGHLALGRSVLGLRWNEAVDQVNAEPYRLGGSRSDDWTLLPLLNQREFALRGYGGGEPTLTGHHARVATAEWRIPLADIDRHLMVPPVGINRLALSLFYDLGAAWDRGADPDYHRGIGVEIMTEPLLGYLLGWQARAGVAKGLDAGGSTNYYLRAGRSF